MKRTSTVCAPLIVALGVSLICSTTSAQNTSVSLVDVAKVFDNLTVFKQQMQSLENEAKQYSADLQAKTQALAQRAESLKGKDPSSSEFRTIEQQLAQDRANLEIERRNRQRHFVEQEASLYFDTYVQVSQVIAAYCEEANVRLILSFNSTPMTVDDPQTIMQTVNGIIVYHTPPTDITDEIIRRVNLQIQGARVGEQPAAGPVR